MCICIYKFIDLDIDIDIDIDIDVDMQRRALRMLLCSSCVLICTEICRFRYKYRNRYRYRYRNRCRYAEGEGGLKGEEGLFTKRMEWQIFFFPTIIIEIIRLL